VGCKSIPDKVADYIHKMVIVGDDGPAKENLISNLCVDWFEDDYSATIGARMGTFCRDVDGIVIKVASWIITNRDDFAELRQAYYQNASLTLLTIEDTSPDSIKRYKEWLDAIHAVCGKIPVSIAVAHRSSIDQKIIDAFASEMDVSQVIMDPANEDATKRAIDRMLRELLACYMKMDPYTVTFLRSRGLTADIKSFIPFIRGSDNPLGECKHIDLERVGPFLESEGASIFIDIELLKETCLARYIPRILEQRAEEMKKTWVNRHRGQFDLRYLWLTAYGFEILRSLGVGLVVSARELKTIVNTCKQVGFDLQVKNGNSVPETYLSKDMKEFVWSLVDGRQPPILLE
jgi:hypothetical protein